MATKIISKDTVFTSKYFSVDKILLEQDGKQFTKDLIKRNDVVLILPVTEENELYLVSQYRVAWDKTLLEVVAGNIENGLLPLDAAKAELEEETGLQAEQWKELGVFCVSANITGKIYVFVATHLTQGEVRPDPDEQIEVQKVSFTEAIKMIEEGKIVPSSNIAAILLYDRRRREGTL